MDLQKTTGCNLSGAGINNTIAKPSNLETALAFLSNQIERMANNVESLHSKLSPILTETPQNLTKSDRPSIGGELAQSINGYAAKIEALNERIAYIKDCLDL